MNEFKDWEIVLKHWGRENQFSGWFVYHIPQTKWLAPGGWYKTEEIARNALSEGLELERRLP